MKQHKGFVLPGNKKKVCKLVKSFYGLEQAPKQWYKKFEFLLLLSGFRYNSANKCIYSKFTQDYSVIICLYVDNLRIVSNTMKCIEDTKRYLSSRFKINDLEEVDTILGIKVRKHSGSYALCQFHYIEKIMNKF